MPTNYDVVKYYRPDGQVIDLSNPPYMMVGHDGFGIGDFTQTWVSPPGLHGSYLYDTQMEAKVVTLEFEVHDVGVIERQNDRRTIQRMFNPLLGPGRIRVEQVNGVTREMHAVLSESMPMPTDDQMGVGAAHFLARFKSHGIPGVYDPTPVSVPITSGPPGNFTFPWSFPLTLSQSGFFNRIVVNNDGDLDTNVHIVLNGPMINPAFVNETTGERFSLNPLTLVVGQQLVIDTDPNALVVQIGGNDAWQYVYDAEFWMLQPGANSILFDIGGTDVNTTGTMTYYTYYHGQ